MCLARALEAFRAIDSLHQRLAGVLKISEVRTIAADELWMSMCYRRASVAIHFTWQKDWGAVKALLPRIEEALACGESVSITCWCWARDRSTVWSKSM